MITEYFRPVIVDKRVDKVQSVIFAFEEDFLEDNIRCIPMAVRFKLDACGIKLQLAEWCKMRVSERGHLLAMPCHTIAEVSDFRELLVKLVLLRTGNTATNLAVDPSPLWANEYRLPDVLVARMAEFGWTVSLAQWRLLTTLQRFVLLKLCKPGHEHKNFPKAAVEFNLV